MSSWIKVELTDEEWMSLLDQTRPGLEACCGNVSALRDVIVQIVRDGCEVSMFTAPEFLMKYDWVMSSHELYHSPIVKIFNTIIQEDENYKKLWEEVYKEKHVKTAEI